MIAVLFQANRSIQYLASEIHFIQAVLVHIIWYGYAVKSLWFVSFSELWANCHSSWRVDELLFWSIFAVLSFYLKALFIFISKNKFSHCINHEHRAVPWYSQFVWSRTRRNNYSQSLRWSLLERELSSSFFRFSVVW